MLLILSTYFTLPLLSLVSRPGGRAAGTVMGATPGAALREAGQPRMEGDVSPCQVLTTSNKMAIITNPSLETSNFNCLSVFPRDGFSL